MMNALIGSRLKVTGSSTATVSAGPMPGSTPIAVPSVVPTSAHPRLCSANAPANPLRKASRVSSTGLEQPLERSGRKGELEKASEEDVGHDRHAEREPRVSNGVTIVECPRSQPEHRGGGYDEPDRL